MTNALSLRPGDRVPDFALPGLDGKLRKFIWSFTGAPVALLAVDDLANLDAGQFAGLIDACKKRCRRARRGRRQRRRWRPPRLGRSLAARPEAPLLLCDADRKFLAALLAQGGMGLGPAGALRMRVIVLDPNQRIAATFDSRALPAAAEAMDGARPARVRSDGGRELLLKTPMAPVLVLPRVFEPDFCTQLVRLWGKGDHKDSGVSSRYGNINMDHLKRTEDYTIVEPMMLKAISDRLAYRIGPELTKVFAFDRQFTFDSHVVLSYSADGTALLRRPSRQRRADHGRPRLRRIAEPQRRFRGRRAGLPGICRRAREPAGGRRRRLLLLAAAPGAAGDARPPLRADDLLPRQNLVLVARRLVSVRQLDPRLVQRRIEDVDARRLVEGAVGARDILARDR